MLQKFLAWLVISSANPDEVSLTFKGMMLQYLGVFLVFLQVFHVPLTENVVVSYIGTLSAMIGTLLGILGLCRKFYYEIQALLHPEL